MTISPAGPPRTHAMRRAAPPPAALVAAPRVTGIPVEGQPSERARLEPWIYLGIGLVSAPVFSLTPLLGYMGWFLASLVHEMGHAAVAWLCGMPAIPAISLAGHAAAVHSEQLLWLCAFLAGAMGWLAWRHLAGHARWIALGLVATLYPLLALTGAKDLLHLVAGHGGELAFATLCLWKTLDGGFTSSRLERALYGTLGWYVLGKNLLLCWGLMASPEARAQYHASGSFGLTNDYIRVANDLLGVPLERVAALMFVAGLLVLPLALLVWRWSTRARAADSRT